MWVLGIMDMNQNNDVFCQYWAENAKVLEGTMNFGLLEINQVMCMVIYYYGYRDIRVNY